MPEQLTLRLRKPGVILLTGDPTACEAVRAALEALGPGFRCEVWYAPDAPRELQEAVARWDGEVWECDQQPGRVDGLECIIVVRGEDYFAAPTWGGAVRAALQEWL